MFVLLNTIFQLCWKLWYIKKNKLLRVYIYIILKLMFFLFLYTPTSQLTLSHSSMISIPLATCQWYPYLEPLVNDIHTFSHLSMISIPWATRQWYPYREPLVNDIHTLSHSSMISLPWATHQWYPYLEPLVNDIHTLSHSSMISCMEMSFSSHSRISVSKGLMNGEPRIVWAFTMWSSSNIWISSMPDRMDTPWNTMAQLTYWQNVWNHVWCSDQQNYACYDSWMQYQTFIISY